ncbi:N-acetylmuramoyl-L-alanine amidase family protein [Hoylesella enoeca]|uniref:N-acetylmuramoyl-L-alanine amidase n=1 Tax=Hoylesella enoeca TaxID=76123 RepID=A0A0S2KLB8_9BACT|nr:N-acetylmuramoyl-L-alanine amidase [Hoylesella enoeca]ALO48770.1 N-acetylmuramoyl-L-alanine amidase [Hoylesella enoeca]
MRRRLVFTLITILLFAMSAWASNHYFTLVIDPGHGGKDHGAPGSFSKEKDLTLKFALAFGRIIEQNCPDVKVVFTRKIDTFLTLADRAALANRCKGDLFVSVHINAVEGSRNARGYQTYTLGRSLRNGNSEGIRQNLEVAKRENSVIYLEKDYRRTYKGFDPNSAESDIMFEFVQDKNREHSVELAKFLQSEICAATGRSNSGAHQDNLAVLRLTSMPGCLMELGFISTPDEEQYLNSDEALRAYSRGFLNAFKRYKGRHDNNIVVPYKPSGNEEERTLPSIVPDDYKQNEPQPMPPPIENNEQRGDGTVSDMPQVETSGNVGINSDWPQFKIQIFVSKLVLNQGCSQFKGLDVIESYREGDLIKYTYGSSKDFYEICRIRRRILDKFPDAFVIAFKHGKRMNINQAIQEFKLNRNK